MLKVKNKPFSYTTYYFKKKKRWPKPASGLRIISKKSN
ncbi:hypothetical protein FM109_15950 [Vibrio casei]|nr:hypothetical protein FM109_15950 [Vibrio casei]